MITIATTTMQRRQIPHTPRSTAPTDISREARAYGLLPQVSLDSRVLHEYEAYCTDQLMTVEECVVPLLRFNLQSDPDTNQVSVILARKADGRPVEVVLELHRRQEEGGDRLYLAFTDETEL